MSEVSVKPTPIQRNIYDVAVELVQLHVQRLGVDGEDLTELYTKYFSLVAVLSPTDTYNLKKLVPEELMKKIES